MGISNWIKNLFKPKTMREKYVVALQKTLDELKTKSFDAHSCNLMNKNSKYKDWRGTNGIRLRFTLDLKEYCYRENIQYSSIPFFRFRDPEAELELREAFWDYMINKYDLRDRQ